MLSESLTKRERLVLEALVRAYVDLRYPGRVPARFWGGEGFEFSPATMRKTLSSLERKGLVSAAPYLRWKAAHGRGLPLLCRRGGKRRHWTCPQRSWSRCGSSLEEVFQQVRADEIHAQLAAILGDVSNQLGLALAPRFEQAVFRKLGTGGA